MADIKKNKTAALIKRLGPDLITGASDDDPSGIGTYSQAGAQLGFGVSWTMLLTYPLMDSPQRLTFDRAAWALARSEGRSSGFKLMKPVNQIFR